MLATHRHKGNCYHLMLEKPDIPDELIITQVQEEFDLNILELTFLPIGADAGTVVYRVVTESGVVYFLKLRKNFNEVIVRLPLFLKESGVEGMIVPFETKSKQHWADFGEYKLILYPFVEGNNGFEVQLTDQQRKSLGAALRKIHTAQVPVELKRLIRKETFASGWRERLKFFQAQVEENNYHDPTAVKLAEYIKSRQTEIARLVEHSEPLALELQSRQREFTLCHSDFHGGNILISSAGPLAYAAGDLFIVDWDDPILAPKERDLMFIGGGIDDLWKSEQEINLFYQGYGETKIDLTALAYYRYERVIEDLVVICDQLLLTKEGGADRERSYGWFTSNFEPGNTIEIAENTFKRLR